jgi:MFS family permease
MGLRKFGARWWLGTAVNLWGIVMMCFAFAQNWQTLAALRAVLGIFESALFPGAAFLISCWYPRKQMALRSVVFYITSAVAGSFAKPLGYCFSLLNGRNGWSGWRWMFLIYGLLTIVIGIIAYLVVEDFPDKCKFLTEEERHIVITRIERDRADSEYDPLTFAKCIKYAKQWRPWLFAFLFMSTTTATYSLAYFLPTILATMGFGNVESMLLGTPAYFWALIPSLICGRMADRVKGTRAYVIIFNSICLIVGTAMYSQLDKAHRAARFAGE